MKKKRREKNCEEDILGFVISNKSFKRRAQSARSRTYIVNGKNVYANE